MSDIPAERLDFLGYTTCPMKQIFREGLEDELSLYFEKTGIRLEWFVPSGCGVDPYKSIWKAERIEEFPDAVMTTGFGNFFKDEFVEKFIMPGYFKSAARERVNKDFASEGFEDPDGNYTLYSVFPYVLLIDLKKLGELPVPRRWSDLLNPVYENNIIIGGSEKSLSMVPLLYLHKEFGEEGLAKFAPNVKDAWHNAKMAKTAGTSSAEGAAVYVLPWFFARSCPRREATEIVWPEDGAYTGPMYLIVKESGGQKLKAISDYITGEKFGGRSANNFYPALHPNVDNKLPPQAKLKWLGWDYIKSHSMDQLIERVDHVFRMNWKAKS